MVNTADWTEAGISTLKPKGTAVFVGGVDAKIGIPYRFLMLGVRVTGSYMFDVETDIPELFALIESKLLKLDWVIPKLFPLQEWKEAAKFAAEGKNGRMLCAISF